MRPNKYSQVPKSAAILNFVGDWPLQQDFIKPNGRKQRIDLSFFVEDYPRSQIASLCSETFRRESHVMSVRTRTNAHSGLSQFNTFLNWRCNGNIARNVSSTQEITADLLREYQVYLRSRDGLGEGSIRAYYYSLTGFVQRMHIHSPQSFPADLLIPNIPSAAPNAGSRTSVISLADLKRISEAAQSDFSALKERHRRALEMLEETRESPIHGPTVKRPWGFWREMRNRLHAIVRESGIDKVFPRPDRIESVSPLELLGWYVPSTMDCLLPILILIYIRSALNVTPLYTLTRHCLAESPLPLNLTTLRLSKPRSGVHSVKELSFPSHQEGGVVELIRFALKYTEPLVPLAPEAVKNRLFLYRSGISGISSCDEICFETDSLARFIKRHDLPGFTLQQLRPTIATYLYLRCRDIFRVQRLLCHRSVRTTIDYIRGPLMQAEHDRELSVGIKTIFDKVTGLKGDVFAQPPRNVIAKKVEAQELSIDMGERLLSGGCNTLVGRCKNPFDSPQPGAIKGKPCQSLHACLFCENCWIFAEDLPQAIAYRNRLLAEKPNMTDSAWAELHGAAVHEIDENVLTQFPPHLVELAETKARSLLIALP